MPFFDNSAAVSMPKIFGNTARSARLIIIGFILLIMTLQNNLVFAAEDHYEPSMEVLVDHSGRASIEIITNNPEEFVFRKVESSGFTGGFSNEVYWFRLELQPLKTPENNNILRLLPAVLDDLEAYFPKENGEFLTKKGGDLIPHELWEIPHRTTAFSFDSPNKPQFAYLRVKTSSQMTLVAEVFTPSRFLIITILEILVLGTYAGILIGAICLNISQGLWIKDAVYKHYIFYLVALALWTSTVEGAFNLLPFGTVRFVNTMSQVTGYLMILTGALYYRALLFNTDKGNKTGLSIFYFLIALLSLGIIVSLFRIDAILEIKSLFPSILSISALCATLFSIFGIAGAVRNRSKFTKDYQIILIGAYFSLFISIFTGLSTVAIIILDRSTLFSLFHLSNLIVILCFQIALGIRTTELKTSEKNEREKKELAIRNIEIEKETNRIQAYFLSILYHEIRTPLTVIRLTLAMKNPSEGAKQHAEESIKTIDGIIDRFAYADSLTSSKIDPTFENCNLEQIIGKIIRQQFKNKNIKIINNFGDSKIESDSELLTIIIRNLIENAVKYSSFESEIKIDLTSQIENGIERKYFSIRNELDHPEEIQVDRIFERYTRTKSAEKTSGSGLGLFIVKGLLDSLHSSITCNVNDKEIEFRISL